MQKLEIAVGPHPADRWMGDFFSACRQDDVGKARKKLKTYPRISRQVVSPLLVASQSGAPKIVAHLLEMQEVDVNAADEWGNTPLMNACTLQEDTIAALLLRDPRVNPFLSNHSGFNPMFEACYQGNLRLVKMLLASNKYLEPHATSAVRQTAAVVALGRGHSEIHALVQEFDQSPGSVVRRLRSELGWPPHAGTFLALAVFVCDGFLDLE